MPKWFAPAVLVSLCMFAIGVAGLVVVSGVDADDADPADADAFFEPAQDKIYRHPTFYEIPDEVENL